MKNLELENRLLRIENQLNAISFFSLAQFIIFGVYILKHL